MKFHSLYKHTRSDSSAYATINREESMTQQDDKDEADINIIMKKYGGKQFPQLQLEPLYGDFTEIGDYRSMVEKINEANEAFNNVPAEIRKRFGYDPQEFIDFIKNPDNLAEMRKLGLAEPEKVPPPKPAPMEVIITNPPEPPK